MLASFIKSLHGVVRQLRAFMARRQRHLPNHGLVTDRRCAPAGQAGHVRQQRDEAVWSFSDTTSRRPVQLRFFVRQRPSCVACSGAPSPDCRQDPMTSRHKEMGRRRIATQPRPVEAAVAVSDTGLRPPPRSPGGA